MGQRGRPKTPDILTSREWEVLELLRQRLSNREIAARLGISFDGARFHVSEILGKLGVESREEAAAWRPEANRRWSMVSQLPVVSGFRFVFAYLGGHKLAAGVLVVAFLALGGGGYSALQLLVHNDPSPSLTAVTRQAADPCDALFTYQCIEAESQDFSTIEDATAVASFVPALPSYIPPGFEPVSIRVTRPLGTTEFIQSESYKQGCPGCDPRMAHNDQIGVYFQNQDGARLALVQGFPAYLAVYDNMPEDQRGTVQLGDGTAYWVNGLPGGDSTSLAYVTLYWDLGNVGAGRATLPDGTTLTGSPTSYSISSNSLSVDELVRIAASISFE